MAHHFDVVPIWVDYERGVVGFAVLGPQSWRPVVFAACVQRITIKSVDLLTCFCSKGQVQMGGLFFGFGQAQRGFAVGAYLDAKVVLCDYFCTQNFQSLKVKLFARSVIADSNVFITQA